MLKLGSNPSHRILQQREETHYRALNWAREVELLALSLPQGAHCDLTPLSSSLKQYEALYENTVKGLHISSKQSLLCFNTHF